MIETAQKPKGIKAGARRTLATEVRAARKRRRLSQRDVADRVGISTKYFSSFETGSRSVSLPLFLRILEVLDHDMVIIPRGVETDAIRIGMEVVRVLPGSLIDEIEKFLEQVLSNGNYADSVAVHDNTKGSGKCEIVFADQIVRGSARRGRQPTA
jgi:transcriptional regulator with XRE-family HTH domain